MSQRSEPLSNPNLLTPRAWAQYMGWSSAGQAYAAMKAGRVVMAPDGKHLLAAESKARYLATADPAKAGVTARHAAQRAAPAPNAPEQGDEIEEESADGPTATSAGSYDFQSAKAKREHYAAERERTNYLKEAGELIEAATHRAAFAAAGAALRAHLEGLPATLAPQLVGRDEGAIRAALAEQMEAALHALQAAALAQTGEGRAHA